MRSFIFNIVALVALVAAGCSVEGNPGGGGSDELGNLRASLTTTIPSGTVDVLGTVMASCSMPGGCSGQLPVSSSTGVGMMDILFPGLNLGSYNLTMPGAPIGAPIPAYYAGDPAIAMATLPYCIYTGMRPELQNCEYNGSSPSPVPVLAGTTNTGTMNFQVNFSDGPEFTSFTGGDLRVVLQATGATVFGDSTSACAAGQLCASIDVAMPTAADLECYNVCWVPDPTMGAPATGPWPAAVPCLYPNECVHVAGIGGTGAAMRGLCKPPTP